MVGHIHGPRYEFMTKWYTAKLIVSCCDDIAIAIAALVVVLASVVLLVVSPATGTADYCW